VNDIWRDEPLLRVEAEVRPSFPKGHSEWFLYFFTIYVKRPDYHQKRLDLSGFRLDFGEKRLD
jgi:hypothetical protein